MKRFLVVGLQGGLGNQIFQYASGYGIARRVGAELFFDRTRLLEGEDYLPGLLGPHYRDASREQLLRLGVVHSSNGVRGTIVRSVLHRLVAASRRMRHMTASTVRLDLDGENAGRYDAQVLSMDLPTMLLGWLQTDRYFSHVAREVVQQLCLPRVTLPRQSRGPVVALSFRRGDYIRLGWQLPFSYYERALALMRSEIPDATFLVFGDDPEFVRLATDWTSRFGPATNAYEYSDRPLEHMVLASECDHAVIANSSFAWWAAWLGDQRVGAGRRVVIAPEDYRQRFGPDILPSNWIAVSSG